MLIYLNIMSVFQSIENGKVSALHKKVEGRLLGSVLFTPRRGCSVKDGALSRITLMYKYTGDRHVDIYIWSASSSVFSLISKV